MDIYTLLFPKNYFCQLSIVNSQLSTLNCQLSIVNSQLSTVNSHNTPFVDGSEKLKMSRLTAIFIAFANALKMPSIL